MSAFESRLETAYIDACRNGNKKVDVGLVALKSTGLTIGPPKSRKASEDLQVVARNRIEKVGALLLDEFNACVAAAAPKFYESVAPQVARPEQQPDRVRLDVPGEYVTRLLAKDTTGRDIFYRPYYILGQYPRVGVDVVAEGEGVRARAVGSHQAPVVIYDRDISQGSRVHPVRAMAVMQEIYVAQQYMRALTSVMPLSPPSAEL